MGSYRDDMDCASRCDGFSFRPRRVVEIPKKNKDYIKYCKHKFEVLNINDLLDETKEICWCEVCGCISEHYFDHEKQEMVNVIVKIPECHREQGDL